MRGVLDAEDIEGDRVAGRGHGCVGESLRRARRVHGRVHDLPPGRRRDTVFQGASGRPLPEPALGLRPARRAHLSLRGSGRDLRGRRRLLRTARPHSGRDGGHRGRRVQPHRGIQPDARGDRPQLRSGAGRLTVTTDAVATDPARVALRAAAAIEAAEARAWADMYAAAPPDWAASVGVGSREIDGALVPSWATTGRRYFSRAIGLGVGRPTTEGALDEILEGYREAGIT